MAVGGKGCSQGGGRWEFLKILGRIERDGEILSGDGIFLGFGFIFPSATYMFHPDDYSNIPGSPLCRDHRRLKSVAEDPVHHRRPQDEPLPNCHLTGLASNYSVAWLIERDGEILSGDAFFWVLVLFFSPHLTCSIPTIGVTYPAPPFAATTGDRSPRLKISSTTEGHKMSHVFLLDSDPTFIGLFASTNVSLVLLVPNCHLTGLTRNYSMAWLWVFNNIFSHPGLKITLISFGTVGTVGDDLIMPALRNFQKALMGLRLSNIKLSATLSYSSTITTAYLPSSYTFLETAANLVIKPLLQFLAETKSPVLIDLPLYELFRDTSGLLLAFALFWEYPLRC
ncbi:Glycoside hydrolase, family 17 [Corchorus olitorius]|uniref:glucan endo-1,3-beta-D-glucosidase n=1 Tax=Corchorus olitorius TaxID=93759 RepID=A0A1R3I0L3_9ROSI|nr:Glycoside hydrolase, family 17 [Corchorus olitorius]